MLSKKVLCTPATGDGCWNSGDGSEKKSSRSFRIDISSSAYPKVCGDISSIIAHSFPTFPPFRRHHAGQPLFRIQAFPEPRP